MPATKKSSSVTKKKVGKVMHEFKHGQLKSGGRAKVKNPKQAIAIALSEAREAGGKVAPRKAAKKSHRKTTGRTASTKRTARRKS